MFCELIRLGFEIRFNWCKFAHELDRSCYSADPGVDDRLTFTGLGVSLSKDIDVSSAFCCLVVDFS